MALFAIWYGRLWSFTVFADTNEECFPKNTQQLACFVPSEPSRVWDVGKKQKWVYKMIIILQMVLAKETTEFEKAQIYALNNLRDHGDGILLYKATGTSAHPCLEWDLSANKKTAAHALLKARCLVLLRFVLPKKRFLGGHTMQGCTAPFISYYSVGLWNARICTVFKIVAAAG